MGGRGFFARSLALFFFPLSSAADPLTSRARYRRVSENGGRRRSGLWRAGESPPPRSWLPAEPPRLRCGPEHVGAARGRCYHVSRAVPSMCLCRGTRGSTRPHAAHTPLPRVEARVEVSQGSEDTALPRLALGKVSGSLFYSTSRFIAGGDGSRTGRGNSGRRGRPPRTGKQRVTPAGAVAGAPGRGGTAPASCPRALGRARRGLARCRRGQGHRRVHRAPCPHTASACSCRAAGRGGGREAPNQNRLDTEPGRPQRILQLGWGQAGVE